MTGAVRWNPQVLEEGGVWINLGPLNYKKELRLKLAWEELQAVWEGMGYTFVHSSRVLPRPHPRS